MLLKYSRPDKIHPPITRIKPQISEDERQKAKQNPPPVLPSHCKPFMSAQSFGYLVTFPFPLTLQVKGEPGVPPTFEISPPEKEQEYPGVFSLFAAKHFGIATDYRLKTEEGIGIYVDSLPDSYPARGQLIRGLIETWWYPRSLFLVFKQPEPGEIITFKYGDPMAVLIPVLCEQLAVEEFTPEEEKEATKKYNNYLDYSKEHPELVWTSAEGHEFSGTYKVFSKANTPKSQRRPESV